MPNSRVLVTGGTGFLGCSLVRRLLHDGHSVRVLDDDSRGSIRRLEDISSDIEFISGDVRDPTVVRRAAKGVQAIAHLAFVNGTEFFYAKPEVVLEIAVKGAMHTLESAVASDVEEYYLVSSSEVYQAPPIVPTDETAPLSIPDPLNPRYSYAGGKLISELLAINYGRKYFKRTVIVRPHNVYGPDMGNEHVIPQFVLRLRDASRQHSAGPLPLTIQGDGNQTRAFVFIDDFTDGCARAFFQGESLNIYHVGTQDEVTILSLAERVASAMGRDVTIIPGPPAKGGTSRRCPDTAKVRALGFTPTVSLDEGIRRTVAWYTRQS